MKNEPDLSQLDRDVLDGLKMGIFDGQKWEALLRLWEFGVCDDRMARLVHEHVHREKRREVFRLTPFRDARLAHGRLVLGLDGDQRPLRIPVQYLNAHCLTIANTGSGKTTRIKFLALQVAPSVKGMWLIDLRKREFRVLREYLARVGVDLVVVPGRRLRINPLQVPRGVDPMEWASRLPDMLTQVLPLPARASKLAQVKTVRLYREFGVFAGATLYPTLFDLFEAIRTDTSTNPPARQAILDSLEPVLLSLGPEVLAYRYGWTPHELAARHLVIELAGLTETAKDLILNYLVLAEFTSRVAQGISNPKMDLFIACDEAQRLCSSARETTGHVAAIADLIGLVRGTGIGLDLAVQSASDVLPQVLSNTTTKILGRCGSGADYAAGGHCMALSSEQIRWAQLNMEPGLFVGQVGEGDWRYPFVFRVPRMSLELGEQADGCGTDEPVPTNLLVAPTVRA